MDAPMDRVDLASVAVGPMFEVACHEGNYAVPNIMRGARAQDGTPDEAPDEPGILCWDCEPR